jgi:cell wall-associated NlpC family hydrolase
MSFTAFLAAFEGTRTVLPGYSTAECVAIFQRYNALVVRGDGYGAVGAQNLWTDNSWTAYSRVPATEPAQRGDVVIWSGSSGAYLGGGYGHVAIVVTDNGPTLAAFGQNPNPATILTLSKSGVLGYLRPHAINP